MSTQAIVSAIDQEIDRLQQARLLLQDVTNETPLAADPGKRRGRPPGNATPAPVPQARTMSEEGRARIAAAQTARWAKKKKAEKKAAKATAASPANPKKVAAPAKKSAGAKAATAKPAAKKVAAPVKKAAGKKASGSVKKSVRTAPQTVGSVEPVNVPTPLPPVEEAVAAE